MEKPSEESVTYIILLTALQVALDCSMELQGTIYDQGKAKIKLREAINQLTLDNAKNRNKIWKTDDIQAANMTKGIREIGKNIAIGNGEVLQLITQLTRQGLDFSKYKLQEIEESK
jgi:phage antirepressor YoqD-like protein